MSEQGKQWQNISAGPRQVKDLQKAMSALRREGQTTEEVSGVVGGKEHRMAYWSPMSPGRPEVTALDEAIRGKYAHQITSGNVRAIISDYEAAMPAARESRPVDDQRRTAEEDAEIKAKIAEREAAEQAERDQRGAVLAQVMAKAPAGAKALIYAESREDASDIQTDYFASHTTRTVAIGWRFSAREDFRALRAAAAAFPETAHMATEDTLTAWQKEQNGRAYGELEHRDNHSMGAGNYLSDHGWSGSGSGWIVKSAAIPCRWVSLTEDAIPAATAAPAASTASASADGITVSPSSLGHAGVIELRFAAKPSEDVREALKRGARFRWARGSGCWYGRQAAYEAAAATGYWQLPPLPGTEPAEETAPEPETAPEVTAERETETAELLFA